MREIQKPKKWGQKEHRQKPEYALGRQDWAVGQVCLCLHRPFFGGAVFSLFEPLPPTSKNETHPHPQKEKICCNFLIYLISVGILVSEIHSTGEYWDFYSKVLSPHYSLLLNLDSLSQQRKGTTKER